MKFSTSIEINSSRSKVTTLFADPDNNQYWQDGFIRKDLIDGIEGHKGAVSKLYYKQARREMELTETIVQNNLPDSFEGHYHHKHMDNTMKCTFSESGIQKTNYIIEIEYTRISWVLPKLMALLFPGMFKKQVEKWMRNFKTFVESSQKNS